MVQDCMHPLRKLAFLSLLVVLLTTAAGSVWAQAMDCCDQGYAACLSDQVVCPSCFAAAPALPGIGHAAFQQEPVALALPASFVVISLDERLIWKPPRNAVFTI